MDPKITILLVDDHPVVRQGISSLLSSFDHFHIAGEADNAQTAFDLAIKKEPDVILLDIRMPGESGLDLLKRLRKSSIESHILILSSFDDDEYVTEALRSGAIGYILKNASDDSLVRAIESASQGERVLSPKITNQVVEQLLSDGISAKAAQKLEADELEILRMLAGGAGNTDVAANLFISPTTLKRKMKRILEKMGVQTRVQAVAEAVRKDLI